ncbi:DinB family protein [Microlunatus aurantiacus]|uniref:DinB family protein n=1 Tax=Microlunatus aurantiacus TaxID=446786 RepID=A0ABP7DBW6_9ACTN
MPGNPPPFDNETDGLLLYLVQQRDGLRFAAYGLTEEQLRLRATPASALTVGGLLKHATVTERGWIDILAGELAQPSQEEYGADFVMADDESLASLLELQAATAARTEAVVRGLPDLEQAVQLPDAPWYPKNTAGYSARWILLHVIEEVARHAGHADIVREHIDGATMYELMAGAEGWPATDWLTPWQPPGDRP